MPSTSSAYENFSEFRFPGGDNLGEVDSGVCVMGVLLEDMPFEALPLIERVGLETEGLGCDIEDVCKPQFLDD